MGGGVGLAIGGIVGLTFSLGVFAYKFVSSGYFEIVQKFENWKVCDKCKDSWFK